MIKTRFLPKTFLIKGKTKFLRQKIKKWKFCLRPKKPRLVADFTLDHTGGWGSVSNRMIMIGNFRVIKGLT